MFRVPCSALEALIAGDSVEIIKIGVGIAIGIDTIRHSDIDNQHSIPFSIPTSTPIMSHLRQLNPLTSTHCVSEALY